MLNKKRGLKHHVIRHKKKITLAAVAGLGTLVLINPFSKIPSPNNFVDVNKATQLTMQFSSSLEQYQKLPQGTKRDQSLASLKSLASQRFSQLSILAEQNPSKFVSLLLPSSTRSSLPQELRGLVESEVTETGTFRVIEKDDFANKKSTEIRTLETKNGTYSVYAATDFPFVPANSKVKVHGFAVANKMVVSDTRSDMGAFQVVGFPFQLSSETKGDQKTLVLLANFSDDQAKPFTKDDAQHFLFDPPKPNNVFTASMNAFFQEASYGQTSFSGDVVDWYTLSLTHANNCNDLDKIIDGALKNAIAKNIDISSYTHFVVYFPNCGNYGYSDIGTTKVPTPQGDLDGTRTWLTFPAAQSNSTYVYQTAAHELGHAIGLRHAHSLNYAPKVIDGSVSWDGVSNIDVDGVQHGSPDWYGYMYDMIIGPQNGILSENGDRYDLMSDCHCAHHPNAVLKNSLGWLKANQIKEVTGSGTYTIEPLEIKGQGIKMLKIPRLKENNKVVDWYLLEYRQPVGFDMAFDHDFSGSNIAQGVYVHWQHSKLKTWPASYLLNMSPQDSSLQNVALTVGKTYKDPDSGISFTPTTSTASGIVIDVQVPTKNPYLIDPNKYKQYPIPIPMPDPGPLQKQYQGVSGN